MEKKEFELVLEIVSKAINEQYIVPLAFALGTLTASICRRDHELSKAVSGILRTEGERCAKKDIAGGKILLALSNIAADLPSTAGGDLHKSLRTSLRLIEGGKKKKPNKNF
jgi:hypothetical protein